MADTTFFLPAEAQKAVELVTSEWRASNKVARIWAKDASVWSGSDEANWLGWLSITGEQIKELPHYQQFAREVRVVGFTHAVLLGMGGSSLCPEVLRLSFGHISGAPDLYVLDSTDPAQVAAIEAKVDSARTLFIVASKSGSTLEPNVFKQHFFERARQAGSRFIAITDPGSQMQKVAERDGFRQIFFGVPSIGGRFSALSAFGLVPAAVMGVDVSRFLHEADAMAQQCAKPVDENPAAQLGITLGTLAVQGRDKLTVIASPGIHDLGAWMEQLVAESTGKDGKAIIPVDREPLGLPEAYGNDRVFVYERLESAPDAAQDRAAESLAAAGHPVIRIAVRDAYDLGREFFRWEFATAVAGSILAINPFNQPDVEASKIATRKLTSEFEATGSLPAETPLLTEDGVQVFSAGHPRTPVRRTLVDTVRTLISTIGSGDYFALLGYIEMNEAHESALTAMRTRVRDRKRVATCVGFGPRFLHSTGQAYKGGGNNGVFLQITADPAKDLPVPGQKYSFGIVEAAQARGDFAVLAERGRRALRIHITGNVEDGLGKLASALERALQ
jgi:transaldolase / glucose-6-phosphate isomerase